jgi:hypothetical protein
MGQPRRSLKHGHLSWTSPPFLNPKVNPVNKIYRIVFNTVTGRWVVASEMAKGRKKAGASAVGGAVMLAVLGTVTPHATMAATIGEAGLEICQNGTNVGINTGTCALSMDGFGLFTKAGSGFTSGEPAYITGTQDGKLTLHGAAGITMMDNVLMNGNKITGLGAGMIAAASTEAINGGQLFNVGQSIAAAFGGGATVNAAGTITAPSYALTNANTIAGTTGAAGDVGAGFGKVDAALGKLNTAITNNTTAVTNITNGAGIKYFHTNSTQADSQATGAESVAIGGSAKAVGAASIALGNNAQNVTGANNSVAIGGDSKSGDKSVTIGNGADTSTQAWSTAIGTNAKSTGMQGVALGSGTQASAANAVALGTNSVGDRTNAVSVGSSSLQRQIIQVARGTVDTDAVNVSQLKGVTAALGGGAGVDAAGAVIAPSYALTNANTIGGTTGAAGNVGAGFDKVDAALGTLGTSVTNLDGRMTKNEGDISTLNTNVSTLDGRVTTVEGSVTNLTNQLSSGTVGLVQQSAAGANLTVGKDTDGAAVDFAGTTGARKLLNVADGTVAAGSKEAVNGGQLSATNDRVTAAEGNITTLQGDVTTLDQRVTTNEGDISTLDGRVTTVEGSVTNITNQLNSGTVGLVQQSTAGANLTVGKDTDGAAVDFAGTTGARKLLNVADGTVAAGSKEAVNGGQLSATNDRVTAAEGNITTLQGGHPGGAPGPSHRRRGRHEHGRGADDLERHGGQPRQPERRLGGGRGHAERSQRALGGLRQADRQEEPHQPGSGLQRPGPVGGHRLRPLAVSTKAGLAGV